MTDARYEIAFCGELLPGTDPAQVRANLARLFQADAQRIAQLFSGRRIVIKQNLDAAGVDKYRQAIERAGARIEVCAMPGEIEEIELAPPPAAAAPAPVGRLEVAPRDEYMAAFAEVQAPDFGIAPVGADLQDARPAAAAPPLDLSRFDLAPVGSDLGELPRETAGSVPDISHLTLAN